VSAMSICFSCCRCEALRSAQVRICFYKDSPNSSYWGVCVGVIKLPCNRFLFDTLSIRSCVVTILSHTHTHFIHLPRIRMLPSLPSLAYVCSFRSCQWIWCITSRKARGSCRIIPLPLLLAMKISWPIEFIIDFALKSISTKLPCEEFRV
jgi:hypothetical protein